MEQSEKSPLIAGDKNKGASYIAAHPEEYGFSWGKGPIGNGVGKDYVELRADCPYIEVTPELVPLFVLTFGGALVSKALNGTSIKVQCDRVNRTTLEKDRGVKNEALREKIVSSILLGVIIRNYTPVAPVFMVGDQTFKSKAEADKYIANAERIRQLEGAQAFLAMAAENEIDPTVARSMARTQYPLAFATDVGIKAGEIDVAEMQRVDDAIAEAEKSKA